MSKYYLLNESEMELILALSDDNNERIRLLELNKIVQDGTQYSLVALDSLLTKLEQTLKENKQ